ncbi:adenylate kinase family protein [Halomarina rubra]|uniref:Putative adenylate kinase n=1 Tax=Halomarina rubra TaxID=2071873 RepID=A0ABD6B1R1_9EURY
MRVAVTGTPGTGKTTATETLDYAVVHLNDVIREEGLHDGEDPDRASLYADFEALEEWLAANASADDETVVVESHLAHHFDADRVVVLRCHPESLESRLRERGETEEKARENDASTKSPQALTRYARENAEAEALDVILGEAVQRHGLESVYEIDTTDRTPEAVAEELRAVLADEREPSAGDVDFTGYL